VTNHLSRTCVRTYSHDDWSQMLRDPFEWIVSDYFYHSQLHAPEGGTGAGSDKFTAPCVPSQHQRCVSVPGE